MRFRAWVRCSEVLVASAVVRLWPGTAFGQAKAQPPPPCHQSHSHLTARLYFTSAPSSPSSGLRPIAPSVALGVVQSRACGRDHV